MPPCFWANAAPPPYSAISNTLVTAAAGNFERHLPFLPLLIGRGAAIAVRFYLSSQTSSMRQPLYMLLVIRVSPFTQGSQQEAPAG